MRVLVAILASLALLFWTYGCSCESWSGGEGHEPTNGNGGGDGFDDWGEWSPAVCHEIACPGTGKIEYCGSCVKDEDNLWPWQNPNCIGPCDNNPDGFYHSLQPIAAGTGKCERDCYYDGNSGGGNDGCFWDHRCDSLEPRVEYCPYDNRSCVDLQIAQCHEICVPIVPNGCDCFGCCQLPVGDGTTEFLFIGTVDGGMPTCSVDYVAGCNPCTPSIDCIKDCGRCQLCLGKTEVPEDCYGSWRPPGDPNDPDNPYDPNDPDNPYDPDDPDNPYQRPIDCSDPEDWDPDYCQCESHMQPCGLQGQQGCPAGAYCVTGCCVSIG